jgi:hypothetical protein
MNDKDKEAFEKWFIQNPVNKFEAEEAWQAACEYKKEEYSNIMDAMTQTSQYNFKLQAENAELKQKLSTVWKEAEKFYLDD